MDWYRFKLFVSHASTLDMDALHVLVGFFGLLLVARVFHRPVTDRRPWLAVLGLELLNEWSDFYVERWPDVVRQYAEAANDIVLTMLVPTVLLLVGRYRPWLLVQRTDPTDPDASG